MKSSNCSVKKIISLVLSVVMLLGITADVDLTAAATDTECLHDGEQTLINQKDAACTSDGYTGDMLCTLCGEIAEYGSDIPATGHEIVTDKAVSATCTNTGKTQGSHCALCGAVITAQKTVAKKSHTYKTTTTKATTSKNGSIVTKCSVCGAKKSSTTIYYPKTVTLSTTSYTYDGKAKKPSVTVKDSKGKKISASNYTVSYASGRKNVGQYTVTIKFKGNYSGTVKKTFTIKPKSTSVSKLTAGEKKFTVKWKKQTTQTTGYQIQYSTDKNFKKNNKTVTVSSNKTTSKTISKLGGDKKYYVRIRTYKTVKINGKNTKIYSSWSKALSITTTSYAEKAQAFIKDSRWNNNISWNADQEPKLSSYVSWGCVAYTSDFCKYVYGCNSYNDAKSTFTSVSSIKSGDVLRLSGSKWRNHWIVVIKRDGNKLYTAEGNVYNNKLGRTAVGDSYYTISGNKLKRSGVGTFSLTKGYHMY